MKAGSLVRLKNLHPEWGEFALVTHVNVTQYGLGQVHVLASGNRRTIPWINRDKYISPFCEEV